MTEEGRCDVLGGPPHERTALTNRSLRKDRTEHGLGSHGYGWVHAMRRQSVASEGETLALRKRDPRVQQNLAIALGTR